MNPRTALVIMLTACGLLTACSAHASAARDQSAVAKVPASRYVVCTSLAVTCTGANARHAPATMYLSGDGSLWAKQLTWTGWGTSTAVGHGTAEENNCKPNCAEGRFSAHAITITLSDPRSWRTDMAYTRATYSIPSLNQHATFARGLLPHRLPPNTGLASPPAPGPVSDQAAVTGTCSAGYEPAAADSNGDIVYGPFRSGVPHRFVKISGTRYAPTTAYQLTLTNTGQSTAQIGGYVIGFYDGSGTELGSDQQQLAPPEYLTAGQSLTWTGFSGTDMIGNGLSGQGTGFNDGTIPATGLASCQLIEWLRA
jgi:hypothetical protein